MRYEIRPLDAWTDPATQTRRSGHAFRAHWTDTLNLLTSEAGHLGAALVIVQLDVTEGDIRRDGMLRASARVGHPGVVVSFNSDVGPLRYATDAFDNWRANLRAIALSLQALRAVDRYGVTSRHEQYVGFRALSAPAAGFDNLDDALRWMREQARPHIQDANDALPRELYRFLARRMHPDVGGDPADWERLDLARQLLEASR